MRTKAQASQEQVERPARSELLVDLAARVVSSFLANHRVAANEVPSLIATVHTALADLSGGTPQSELKPAIPVKKSVTDTFIVCLEDGKKLSMLKRYLRAQYDMSPDDYRKKWGLPHDYPMVAPAYARLRSAFAKKIGLGRIPAGEGGKPSRRR